MMQSSDSQNRINIIFAGNFPYPQGMASTKRIQHAIDGLQALSGVTSRVLVLRQSGFSNPVSGYNKGVYFETVSPEITGLKYLFLAPLISIKVKRQLRKTFLNGHKNILYVYGPPTPDTAPLIRCARHLGFKIICDIVEDDEAATHISSSLLHRAKIFYIRRITSQINKLVDGIIVISSHLEKKFSKITAGEIPLHLRPVSVDFSCFGKASRHEPEAISLFYSGSFGVKDGVLFLLDAFETLAPKHPRLRLVLTGKGTKEAMGPIISRINNSKYSSRIDYKGYLDDKSYYETLALVDIPCMTRIDSAYAQAGFPFKLGEFLATGKPVITSRVSDVENYLSDKINALLVRPGKSEDIVEAVNYIINNPAKANEIAKQGQACSQQYFDYKTQAHKMHSFFSTL